MELKAEGALLYIIGKTYPELGGSEYYKLNNTLGNSVPQVRAKKAQKTFKAVIKAIKEGTVKACHDLSEGGLAVATSEMALAADLGATLNLKAVPAESVERDDFLLFAESNSRFLIEVNPKDKEAFEAIMKGIDCAQIGTVTKNPQLKIAGLKVKTIVDASVSELRKAWKRTLSTEAQA
jgi:phosphoribosylformylglycinamidine synthase